MRLPRILKRPSGISGSGVFAAEAIPAATFIVEYKGQKISAAESDRREARYLARGRIWCFKLSTRVARDAAFGGNTGRYLNHACRPNCYTEIVGDRIWIRALRAIRRGEELTYDYCTDGEAGMRCLCRPGCRTML
ncbi:MAG: SET domain-containing protein-lysine N-methyltransferase [Acidobacteriota bacterium]|nr:SET domain-containing protein-lysine N-methyltransferase [Acidobacteriota bacterium]